MAKQKLISLTRRGFLKASGAFSALMMFSNPLKLFASPNITFIDRNDLGAASNQSGTTGFLSNLMDIAQISDVHIIDPGHELRALNLEAFGVADLGPLLDQIPSTSRVQDHLTGTIFDAVIRSVNKQHALTPFDFVICTGDHTDTDLELELRWFVEIADGKLPSDYQERVEWGDVPPLDPQGLDAPWYTVIGNHDIEYMGTFNSELLIGLLINILGGPDTKYLADLDECIDKYKFSDSEPPWHGFNNMPQGCPKEGYYSYTPKPYIHCIVLNTANYNLENGFKAETMSLGALDMTQFDWMKDEIEANDDKLCVIFSHHSPKEFHPLAGIAPQPIFVSAEEFENTLGSYENVIAHINGHTHANRVIPIKTDNGGYWDINTCSIIEYPQEWRNIGIKDNSDGTGTISCAMVQHENTECIEIALTDPDANPEQRSGTPDDRDVNLLFNIPEKVAQNILDNLPDNQIDNTPDQANAKNQSGTPADLNSNTQQIPDEDDTSCFVATAAFGTPFEPEVMILRGFRDKVLLNNIAGKLFVKTYYKLSPPAARFIAKRPHARAFSRALLRPLVKLVSGGRP